MKLSVALSGAALLATTSAQSDVSCVDGVHIIVARASLEPEGFGIIGLVANDIIDGIEGSDRVAVPYPATISDYINSQSAGVSSMTQLIRQYGDACPGNRMVLLGYSQGAHVVGDTLVGAQYDGVSFPESDGVGQSYLDSICGVIMMGDPANVAGQGYLVGNSTNDGIFPRTNAATFYSAGIADRMQSYCDANDTYCDQGSSSLVHAGYTLEYGDRAVDFVRNSCSGPSGSNSSYTGSGPNLNSTGTGNSTSSSNTTSTVTDTEPDQTPSPTSNGDQGIYTTRASATPTDGASSSAAAALNAGYASSMVAVLLATAITFALSI